MCPVEMPFLLAFNSLTGTRKTGNQKNKPSHATFRVVVSSNKQKQPNKKEIRIWQQEKNFYGQMIVG